MKHEGCVLPVKCERCHGIFDLWYDLQAQGKTINAVNSGVMSAQSLCWVCRKEADWEIQEANAHVGEYEIDLSFE